MSETFTTYGIGPDKHADELQALRDERDRLSAALLNVRVAWNNKNETTSLHVWHERMKAAMADVEAAMTPARGQELEDKCSCL